MCILNNQLKCRKITDALLTIEKMFHLCKKKETKNFYTIKCSSKKSIWDVCISAVWNSKLTFREAHADV